jgi:hypothetical protein
MLPYILPVLKIGAAMRLEDAVIRKCHLRRSQKNLNVGGQPQRVELAPAIGLVLVIGMRDG